LTEENHENPQSV